MNREGKVVYLVMKEITFLIVLLGVVNSSSYNEEYLETVCQHNSTAVLRLSSESFTLTLKSRKGNGYGKIDCYVSISARDIRNGHVMLSVRRIDFENNALCNSYIEVFNGTRVVDKLCGNFDHETAIFASTDLEENYAKVHYHTATSSTSHFGVEIVATAYAEGPCSGRFDFRCSSGICISNSLKCDGFNNCGDRSDETDCQRPPRGDRNILIGALVFFAFVVVSLSVIIYCLCKRRNSGYESVSGSYPVPPKPERHYSTSFPVFHT